MNNNILRILGLDLGTNSIGWALVEIDHEARVVRIMGLGSRIIPMSPAEISKFENGGHMDSPAAFRRQKRQPRRMNERFILRRDRLNYVLSIYSMLPEHYRLEIDMETPDGARCGKLKKGKEPKIAYCLNEEKHRDGKRDKFDFLFDDAYEDMCKDLIGRDPKFRTYPIPKDWTLYYLRKLALTEPITMEQLAWVLHSFNQKRGYEKVEGAEENTTDAEVRTCSVTSVSREDDEYGIALVDCDNPSWTFNYTEKASEQMTFEGDFKQVEINTFYNEEGKVDNKKSNVTITELRTLTPTAIVHNKVFDVTFCNGWQWQTKAKRLDIAEGKPYTFICSTEYSTDGEKKKRTLKLSVPEDNKANWAYIKLDTETKIEKYNHEHGTKGIAAYIYDNLLSYDADKLHTRIRGNLVESIERRYYHDEIMAILTKQANFHDELNDNELYHNAVSRLYPHNESHQRLLLQQSFAQLIADDVLLYQRELKSKKSEIDDCKFETYTFMRDGKKVERPVKAAHTANPHFQEFRIWKFINQLRILELPNNQHASPLDVTEQYLTFEARASLFEEMQTCKTVKATILQRKYFNLPNKGKGFTWNYEADHKEKGNETRYDLMCRLRKVEGLDWQKFLDATHDDNGKKVTNEYMLWHFFYSVKRRSQRVQGLPTLVSRLLAYAKIDEVFAPEIVKNLITFGSYPSKYCAYSEKALLKLLPLMRCGKYWNAEDVARITGVVDDEDCQGLMEHAAVDLVYADKLLALRSERWESPADLIHYMKRHLKQGSLKNPIVEKVVREMLYVVHDIWQTMLDTDASFHFDEIHVELGRELQKSPKQKLQDKKNNDDNKLANRRAKVIIDSLGLNGDSPFMREKFRIYEDCVLGAIRFDKKEAVYEYKDENGNIHTITKKEIEDIQKNIVVTLDSDADAKVVDQQKQDVRTYRLWLDKRFSSPYTGFAIPLKDIFDRTKYQREHVWPQERITLNSLKNLFMCEASINKAKSAKTGMQFVKSVREVDGISILTEDKYREWVQHNITDPMRREVLLSEQVPERFTNNQLNNTRYISRMAMSLLSRVVRTKEEQGALSANVLSISGSVTATLRRDWRMGNVWNEIIAPRFKRMNSEVEKLTGKPTTLFGEAREIDGQMVFIPEVPEPYRDTFEKKRIDHRHHALDALVVALTERAHVQYINNVSGEKNSKDSIQTRCALKMKHTDSERFADDRHEVRFLPPMQYKESGKIQGYRYAYCGKDGSMVEHQDFAPVVLAALKDTLVSFKQNMRITSQRENVYRHWDEGKGKIVETKEAGLEDESKWCLRQPLTPTETVYGQRFVNGVQYLSTKWGHSLESFASLDKKNLKAVIDAIADKGVQYILNNYLESCGGKPEVAFSPEGIAFLNANITKFTRKKKGSEENCQHMPIRKVSLLQKSDKGHALSLNDGVKSRQFTKDNANVLCYFYPDSTVLVKTLDMIIRGIGMPEGESFVLRANDLVYIPTDEQRNAAEGLTANIAASELGLGELSPDRIYKAVSFEPSGNSSKVLVMPSTMAEMIISGGKGYRENDWKDEKGKDIIIKGEITLTSEKCKSSRSITIDCSVRDVCWKIVLDRLGHIDHLITRYGIRINFK